MENRIRQFIREALERTTCFFAGHDPTENDVNGYRLCRTCGALLKDREPEARAAR